MTNLLQEANGLLDQAVQLRRRIHRHPELGLQLPRTRETVLESLDGLGYRIRTGDRCSSVIAVLDGPRPGPTVLREISSWHM
jgi:metal-dependent amidase/aminoacylase/carboxypeptidase family protein